jgi:hypothetical protein
VVAGFFHKNFYCFPLVIGTILRDSPEGPYGPSVDRIECCLYSITTHSNVPRFTFFIRNGSDLGLVRSLIRTNVKQCLYRAKVGVSFTGKVGAELTDLIDGTFSKYNRHGLYDIFCEEFNLFIAGCQRVSSWTILGSKDPRVVFGSRKEILPYLNDFLSEASKYFLVSVGFDPATFVNIGNCVDP